jgi:hypothetical protein
VPRTDGVSNAKSLSEPAICLASTTHNFIKGGNERIDIMSSVFIHSSEIPYIHGI